MSELYSNEPNKIVYEVTVHGQALPADYDTFQAKLWVGNDKSDLSVSYDLVVDEDDIGKYQYYVRSDQLEGFRYARIDISYDLEDYGTIRDHDLYEITRRYVSFAEANKFLGEEYAIDYDTFTFAERDVRMNIDQYCGQSFNSWRGSMRVRSRGGYIQLPQHLEDMDYVHIGSESLNITYADTVNHGFDLSDGGMSIVNQDRQRTVSMFRSNPRPTTFNISGLWGYISVPTAVKQGALALLKASLCDDKEYRNKYIDNIRNENIRIQLRDEAFDSDTTGHAFVDDILSPYKVLPLGVI